MSLADLWFGLFVIIIAGYLILDGFDMGVGILHLPLARTDLERRTMLNSIGPVWDGNEVWLVLGGGVLFAVFPLVYASLFSGFYLAMMLVLVTLILRAVAIEFRSKEQSPRWRSGWDFVFWATSAGMALLLGVAFGNVLAGVPLDSSGNISVSLIDLLSPLALLFGVTTVAMLTFHGALFLTMKVEGEMTARLERWIPRLARRLRSAHDHDRGGTHRRWQPGHRSLHRGHLAGHLPRRRTRGHGPRLAPGASWSAFPGFHSLERHDRAAPDLGSDRHVPQPAPLDHRSGLQPHGHQRRLG